MSLASVLKVMWTVHGVIAVAAGEALFLVANWRRLTGRR
jgi:hypothetical protein